VSEMFLPKITKIC